MDVELRQLRSFLTLAEELSFTRAAARLHLDQPALSLRIRRLDATLGVPLFLRTSRSVALTAAGEHLRDEARVLVAALDDALAEVRRRGREAPQRLRLGWIVPFRDQLMARLVRDFEERSGDVVGLVRYPFTDPSAGLGTGEVDAAIVNPPLGTPGLHHQVLLREPRVLIAAEGHPATRRGSTTLAELDALDVVRAVPPSNDRVWQAHWAAADLPGRALPARRVEFTENQDYLQAVAAGHVVGLNLPSAVGDAVRDWGITAVPVTDTSDAVIALAWREDDHNPLLPLLSAAATAVTPHPRGAAAPPG